MAGVLDVWLFKNVARLSSCCVLHKPHPQRLCSVFVGVVDVLCMYDVSPFERLSMRKFLSFSIPLPSHPFPFASASGIRLVNVHYSRRMC